MLHGLPNGVGTLPGTRYGVSAHLLAHCLQEALQHRCNAPCPLASCEPAATRRTMLLVREACHTVMGHCQSVELSADNPAKGMNLLQGEWYHPHAPRPLLTHSTGRNSCTAPTSSPKTSGRTLSMQSVPKSGLHSPLKDPEAYFRIGEVNGLAASGLTNPRWLTSGEAFAARHSHHAPNPWVKLPVCASG